MSENQKNIKTQNHQDQPIKQRTCKEAIETARLQLTLNEKVEQGLRKFNYFCITTVITVVWLLIYFHHVANSGHVDATIVLIFSTLLIVEGAGLYKYKQFNPISVFRAMLHEHDYGLVLCAIRGSQSRFWDNPAD